MSDGHPKIVSTKDFESLSPFGKGYTSLFNATDHRSLVTALAKHHRYAIDDDDTLTYTARLSAIPFPYVGKAAVELLDVCKWFPTIAEWTQEARRWWREDSERKEKAEQSRQIAHKEQPLEPGELRKLLAERADGGDVFALKLLDNLKRIGKPLAPPTIDWQALNDELDERQAKRLEAMTDDERKAREDFLAILHRPQRGSVGLSSMKICDGGCGRTLKTLDIGYVGPAPAVQGDVMLCRDCAPGYSWARRVSNQGE